MGEITHCNGLLKDGTMCEVCEFRPAVPDLDYEADWVYAPSEMGGRVLTFTASFCPKCGVKLGVTPDGQPTRGPRILRPLLDIETYFEAALLEAMAQGEGGSYAAALGRVSCAFGSWLVGDFVELRTPAPRYHK